MAQTLVIRRSQEADSADQPAAERQQRRQDADFDSRQEVSVVAHVEGSRLSRLYGVQHLYHPRAYIAEEDGGLMEEYKYLTQHVSIWDVAVERQIQVKGPDAAAFVDYVITRDVDKVLNTMQARYVILCNQYGGIINDPVLLRVAEDEFWFSISDSDVALWAQGVNSTGRFDVDIHEIDVSPVQIQGPKSAALMEKMFGAHILEIPYYGLIRDKLNGHDVTISRTGFSAEVGFEIYLHDAMLYADDVWPHILEQGEEFNLRVIAPGHARRIEAGILSYGQDMDIENNPFEVRLGWQVDLEKGDYIGKEALARIKAEGVQQRLVGLRLGGEPLTWYNEDFYLVKDEDSGADVGYVTSAFYSPNLGTNIALATMPRSHWRRGDAGEGCAAERRLGGRGGRARAVPRSVEGDSEYGVDLNA